MARESGWQSDARPLYKRGALARVLVIDDNVEICRLLEETLAPAGYDVLVAADGEAGIRLHRERPADLVITDIFMPEKDGIETILELRRDYPGIRIIAISGGGALRNLSYLAAAEQLGAFRTIPKPFDCDEVLETVRAVLAT